MRILLPLAALLAASCQSTTDSAPRGAHALASTTVEADEAIRGPMLDAVRALEGRWTSETPYGDSEHTFTVTSSGSVVREIMMPGGEFEMTNMYHLDGNSIVMTHYCGAGNQPRMRATSFEDGVLAFESDSVTDLKDPKEHYMGTMTLKFISDDVVEQHWMSIEDGVESEIGVFKLTRAK